MKKIYNYWLPSTDDHFERLIKKRINAGGPAEYQDDVRTKAYQFVKNFDVADPMNLEMKLNNIPTDLKAERCQHVSLEVSDIEKSLAFYRNFLISKV